jgi:hypothetical protein
MPATYSKVNDTIREADSVIEKQAKLTYYQRLVFAATFLNYALAHWLVLSWITYFYFTHSLTKSGLENRTLM